MSDIKTTILKYIAYFVIIGSTGLIIYNLVEKEPFLTSISSILVIISMVLLLIDFKNRKNSV